VEDFKRVKLQSAKIGLSLNPSKFEKFLVRNQNLAVVHLVSDLLAGVRIVSNDSLEMLGAPLTDEALPSALARKIATIQLLAQRLQSLNPRTDRSILLDLV
jgi:hypothetical protein